LNSKDFIDKSAFEGKGKALRRSRGGGENPDPRRCKEKGERGKTHREKRNLEGESLKNQRD